MRRYQYCSPARITFLVSADHRFDELAPNDRVKTGGWFIQLGFLEPLFSLDPLMEQPDTAHQPAANRVLEILHLVTVGRPVQGMRVGQSHEGSGLPGTFGV